MAAGRYFEVQENPLKTKTCSLLAEGQAAGHCHGSLSAALRLGANKPPPLPPPQIQFYVLEQLLLKSSVSS